MSTQKAPQRNSNIDILRAVAILLVMVVHFPRLRQFLPILNPWSGVDLFFAISGYVVANSFVPTLDRELRLSQGEIIADSVIIRHFKSFFIRRFMRITPPLCFALVLYIGIGRYIAEPNLAALKNIFAELFAIFTYTANFYAAYHGATSLGWHWSLAAEEQFYFIFPFFIVLCRTAKTRIWTSVTLIALLTFIIRPYGEAWFGIAPASMYLPQFRNDALAYGFLVFLARDQLWLNALSPSLIFEKSWIRSVAIFLLISAIALAPQVALNFNFAIPIIGISSALLMIIAICSNSPFFSFKPIRIIFDWIGTRSYGLYLLHIPIVRLVQHAEYRYIETLGQIDYPAHLVILACCLISIVEFSYKFVEMPAIRLGKYWSDNILSVEKSGVLSAQG